MHVPSFMFSDRTRTGVFILHFFHTDLAIDKISRSERISHAGSYWLL